jgi:glycine cleavage system H protein
MGSPENLRYTDDHEWARLEADGTITVGITDHAQDALGDVVFVDLPAVGQDARRQRARSAWSSP